MLGASSPSVRELAAKPSSSVVDVVGLAAPLPV
jgi:hypothetical protein